VQSISLTGLSLVCARIGGDPKTSPMYAEHVLAVRGNAQFRYIV